MLTKGHGKPDISSERSQTFYTNSACPPQGSQSECHLFFNKCSAHPESGNTVSFSKYVMPGSRNFNSGHNIGVFIYMSKYSLFML